MKRVRGAQAQRLALAATRTLMWVQSDSGHMARSHAVNIILGLCLLIVTVPSVSAALHEDADPLGGAPTVQPVHVSVTEEERCMDRSWGEHCVDDVHLRIEATNEVRAPTIDASVADTLAGTAESATYATNGLLCDSSSSCANLVWSLIPRYSPPTSTDDVAEMVCEYSTEEPGHNLYPQSADCLYNPDPDALPIGTGGDGGCDAATVDLETGPWSQAVVEVCL